MLYNEWKICSKQQALVDMKIVKKYHLQVLFIDTAWPWWLTIDFLLLKENGKIIQFVPLHEKNLFIKFKLTVFKLYLNRILKKRCNASKNCLISIQYEISTNFYEADHLFELILLINKLSSFLSLGKFI